MFDDFDTQVHPEESLQEDQYYDELERDWDEPYYPDPDSEYESRYEIEYDEDY